MRHCLRIAETFPDELGRDEPGLTGLLDQAQALATKGQRRSRCPKVPAATSFGRATRSALMLAHNANDIDVAWTINF